MTPRDVVLAAYRAANRGRYAEASTFVVPEIPKMLTRSFAALAASTRKLEQVVRKLARRGEHERVARLRVWIRLNRKLVPLSHPHYCWKVATRGRSLLAVEATRQVIRGSRAKVYLRLLLRNGRVERDSEPLVRRGGRWLLG
jgi:hypothetical protein